MDSYLAAGFLALAIGAAPALAQNAQAPPSPQAAEKPAQKPPQKPKKVWTNDDLAELRSTVQITTASAAPASEGAAEGEATAAAAAPGAEKTLPQEKDPKYYRSKLAPLRQQRDQLDAKIKEIQDALSNPYQGTNKISLTQPAPNMPPGAEQGGPPRPDDSLYGSQVVTPKDQLAVYQKQRDDVQRQIDDLESQARSNGLDPGDIR
jgi:hypothetical protein